MTNDLFAILVRLSVVGSFAVLLVGVLRAPVRRAVGAEAAYWLWLLVPACLVAVLLPRAPSCLCGPESYVSPFLIRGIATPLEFAPQVKVSDHASTLTVAWGLGAAAMLAYFACSQHLLRKSIGLLQSRPDGTYSSPTAEQPMLVGAWRPRIILPHDFESRYSESERTLILAHERAHVRRRDALTNAIALGLVCLSWFNPIGYWAWSRFRFDQELACDAVVLRAERVSRRRYARALARTQIATGIAVAFGWRRRHPLIERVALLRHRAAGRTQRVAGYALALVLMLSGTYVVWAAQPEEAPAAASFSSGLGTPQGTSAGDSSQVRVSGQSVRIEENRIVGAQLRMILAPHVPVNFEADSLIAPKDGGSWILSGHVRITARVTRTVRAGPEVITNDVRPVIATAERAVVSPQRGGGFDAQLEKGTVQF